MARLKRFQYDTLLRIREHVEEARAIAFAKAKHEVQKEEQNRQNLIAMQHQILDEAGKTAVKRFSAADVRQFYQFERHLSHLVVEKEATIDQLMVEQEKRRCELEDAMKQKKIVERMKERHQESQDFILRKNEQAVSDESAVNHAAIERFERNRV